MTLSLMQSVAFADSTLACLVQDTETAREAHVRALVIQKNANTQADTTKKNIAQCETAFEKALDTCAKSKNSSRLKCLEKTREAYLALGAGQGLTREQHEVGIILNEKIKDAKSTEELYSIAKAVAVPAVLAGAVWLDYLTGCQVSSALTKKLRGG